MDDIKRLLMQFNEVRQKSESICQPLSIEDYVVQTMPDVSPPKWHLAHTSWFFEAFLLIPYLKKYSVFNLNYHYLYNSYYESLGKFYPRHQRGLLSRPTVEEIYDYRNYINQNIASLLQSNLAEDEFEKIYFALELGIHHEQQHQELMLMDIKYNFYHNPLRPIYLQRSFENYQFVASNEWRQYEAGVYKIGHEGNNFAFDNEGPNHPVYLTDFKIQNRLITNGEYLEFIKDGGYKKPKYWLADGWQNLNKEDWRAPLYWEQDGGQWLVMTLHGLLPINFEEPVCHVSYYEADAFARWAGARLPGEAEWEVASQKFEIEGNLLETGPLQPIPRGKNDSCQFFGDVWEWTQSGYQPYPGYKLFQAPFTEYNGKFACNQLVLRGGCAVTPKDHIRNTYRNFFYPHQRWPFTGIRLARDKVVL